MDYKETFAKRLISLREQKNITQQELADELGITRQSLSLYEKAERTINIELLAKIADFFNVSTDYLMGRTDTATLDESIQTTCKVTGLSESAITKIIELKKYNLPVTDRMEFKLTANGAEIINSLVLDQWFEALIQRLALYYIRTRFVVYKIIEDNFINLEQEKSLAKLALFESIQASSLIAENFKSPHFEKALSIIEKHHSIKGINGKDKQYVNDIDKLRTEFEKEVFRNAKHNPTSE